MVLGIPRRRSIHLPASAFSRHMLRHQVKRATRSTLAPTRAPADFELEDFELTDCQRLAVPGTYVGQAKNESPWVPFGPNAAGRALLDTLPLSREDVAKIAAGNAERVLRLGHPAHPVGPAQDSTPTPTPAP